MKVRIYQQPKTAMQSGTANTHDWVLEYEPVRRQTPDPLMGWIGNGDTTDQVSLHFDTREEAVAYAERNGMTYEVELPRARSFRPKAYADNFKFGRSENWTH
jgi:hypothetical protein